MWWRWTLALHWEDCSDISPDFWAQEHEGHRVKRPLSPIPSTIPCTLTNTEHAQSKKWFTSHFDSRWWDSPYFGQNYVCCQERCIHPTRNKQCLDFVGSIHQLCPPVFILVPEFHKCYSGFPSLLNPLQAAKAFDLATAYCFQWSAAR